MNITRGTAVMLLALGLIFIFSSGTIMWWHLGNPIDEKDVPFFQFIIVPSAVWIFGSMLTMYSIHLFGKSNARTDRDRDS